MYVHRPRVPRKLAAPYALVDGFAKERKVAIPKKKYRQIVFPRPERNRRAVPRNDARPRIYGNVSQRQFDGTLAVPLKHRVDARQQFDHLKGLYDIIVRSEAQPCHAVIDTCFRR